MNYLRFGTDFTGRNYTLRNGKHPNLRGVMTWSINWDAAAGCASADEFSESYDDYFTSTLSVDDTSNDDSALQMYPNPVKDILTLKTNNGISISSIKIFNMIGKEISQSQDKNNVDLSHLKSGLYLVKIETDTKKTLYKKLIKE